MLIQTEFEGRESLGVYCRSTDERCLIPPNFSESIRQEAEDALEVPIETVTIGGTSILGALTAMNANGILVADIISERERQQFEEAGLEVGELGGVVNAAGNAVLCNDHGAIVDPRCPDDLLDTIEGTLDVPVEIGTVGGVRTPAAAALVTNEGALLHPKATEAEIATVEDVLGVDSMPGTVNHGSPYVGSGVVANTHGALIGSTTTGPELNRLEDALGYLE